MQIESRPLEGRHVRLEPYADPLREPLRAALDSDPAAFELWTRPCHGGHFDAWWSRARASEAAGTAVNYVVLDGPTGRVLGTTSLFNLDVEHATVEIGGTFYRPQARGGPVNPECKRLLFGAAFDAGANRVQLMTDARNLRSQAAIDRLGAVREGVLRAHRVTWTGHHRDTVVFSVVRAEWPAVRDRLDARLAGYG